MHRDPHLRLAHLGVQLPYDLDPQLDVLALQLPYELAVGLAQPVQFPVVEGDQRPVVEREVDVAVDQRGEYAGRVARRFRDAVAAAGQQPFADADEQLREHRVLAREVAVQAGAADAHRGPYLVHADAVESALREEAGSLAEDLLAPGRGGRSGAHGNPF